MTRLTLVPVSAVEIVDLVKQYRHNTVVDGISLNAPYGQVTALLGPNGAGKTTTVECCVGLRKPDGGIVRVLETDPQCSSPAIRARIGVMLQESGMPSGQRADDVLSHLARLYANPLPLAPLRSLLGIDAFAATSVRRISGGQRQRLAVAAALIGQPEVLFLDEPSAGLDPAGQEVMWEIVRRQRAAGTAVFLTTHNIDEAELLADNVHIMADGRIIATGSPKELTAAAGAVITAARPLSPNEQAQLSQLAGCEITLRNDQLVLPTDVDAQLAADITAWGARNNVLLSISPCRLHDVFLDLTGRNIW